MMVAVTVAVLEGFFIPSITQKTSFGGLKEAGQSENIHIFLRMVMKVEDFENTE